MRAGSGSKPGWALIPPATPTSPQPGRGVCPGESPPPAMVTIFRGQTALLWQAWHRGTKWGCRWLGSGWWVWSGAHAEAVGRSGWEHPGWETCRAGPRVLVKIREGSYTRSIPPPAAPSPETSLLSDLPPLVQRALLQTSSSTGQVP